MRFFCCSVSFLTMMVFFPFFSSAQNVEVDISSCEAMLNVLTIMKNGGSKQEVSSMLDSVLQTKPYQIMFKHYNRSWRPNHLAESVFKRMILSLRFDSLYSKGENERADRMLPFWREYYNNPALFQENIHQLKNTDLKTLINNSVSYAQSWLPPEWHIPDFYMTIHPDGGSPAFVIDTTLGYDFFQLPRDSSGKIQWAGILGIIRHEAHHLGMKTPYPEMNSPFDSSAYKFLSLFAGEGTATKFIDNYPGGYVPAVDCLRDSSFNNAEVRKWWEKYTLQERDLFDRLVLTFEKVYSGELSAAELNTEISQFWLNGYVSPVYFVGSELFGAVYHAFGKQGAFTAMKDLRQLFSLYNNAIKSKPELLGNCCIIPDSTVNHALSIGKLR